MDNIDYGLKTLKPDEIYNLLPYVVRATDPNGAIRALFNGLEELHNFAIQKLRELPRLQDPDLCGKFSPSDFNEDVALYVEYLALLYTEETRDLTDEEVARKEYLVTQLPQSLEARSKELSYLSMLADTIGSVTVNKFFTRILRLWIKTGVLRNHINGTHSAVFLLGRALGFVDLKVAELWSRFAIKDPSEPKAPRNDVDFAYASEQFPYYPNNRDYGNIQDITRELIRGDGYGNDRVTTETLQFPNGQITYTPEVDDGGFTYTIRFNNVGPDVASRYHINLQVDGHNPFGNFTTLVTSPLEPGSYQLSGGTNSTRAYASIRSKDGATSYVFESITYGTWANQIILSVEDHTEPASKCDADVNYALLEGPQAISIEGPQSKIKFKTSYFDLITAIDPTSFLQSFPAIPVVEIPNLVDLGSYSYAVNPDSNTLSITLETVPNISVGDTLLITNSTSQFDVNGWEVNRNKEYQVVEVDGVTIVASLLTGENCQVDPNTVGLTTLPFIASNSSGSALLSFEDSIQHLEVGGSVIITGSSSYDGTQTITVVNALNNTINVGEPYTGDAEGFLTYEVLTGYADGIIPLGEENSLYNGKILKRVFSVEEDSAGTFPIKGDTRGLKVQSDGSDFQLNIKVYFEILSIVRRLFEQIRPATRTVRKEFNGLLFSDNVNYAPLTITNSVILQSPAGYYWKLKVSGSDRKVSWVMTEETASVTVVQRDTSSLKYLQWSISDAGVFHTIEVFDVQSILVYITAASSSDQSCYVYVENNSLVTSVYSPEFAVDEIHLVGGSEDYLSSELASVVESCSESIKQWMASESYSTEEPSSRFTFQSAPEDSLSQNDIFQDHVLGHLSIPWLQDAKFVWVNGQIIPVVNVTNSDGFSDGLFQHHFNDASNSSWHGGEFRGSDVRWDSRGISTGIITPVPTGTLEAAGLDHAYPIAYLDHHNITVWRDRVTNDPYVSTYSHSSNIYGPVRSESSLSYLDGPTEPVATSGAFSHVIEIETLWKKSRSELSVTQSTYGDIENSGGYVRLTYDSTESMGVVVGDMVLLDEPAYPGVYFVRSVEASGVILDTLYTVGSTLSFSLRKAWFKIVSLDVYEHDAIVTLDVTPLEIGLQHSKVKVYGSNNLSTFSTSNLLLLATVSASASYSSTVNIFSPAQDKKTYTAFIQSGYSAAITLSQDKTSGVLKNEIYGGALCWQGSEKDVLEVTLLNPWDISALNYNESTTSPLKDYIVVENVYVPDASDETVFTETSSSTRYLWRGGHFAGNDDISFDQTGRVGVAPLITSGSGASYYLWKLDGDGNLVPTNYTTDIETDQTWLLGIDGIYQNNSVTADPFWTVSGTNITPL